MREDLAKAAMKFVTMLPPARVDLIADGIRDLTPSDSRQGLYQLVNAPIARSTLDELLTVWNAAGVSGDELAGVLMGASYAFQKAREDSSVELVWTGPTTPFMPTRRTEQVLLDLIRSAETEIFIVSFVAYDLASIVDALNSKLENGVIVRILLEASKKDGGSLKGNPIAAMKAAVKSAILYTWVDREPPFTEGRVHAKIALADDRAAFLSSANLTGHALAKNMEAGLFINGGNVPSDLYAHLHALIDTKVLKEV